MRHLCVFTFAFMCVCVYISVCACVLLFQIYGLLMNDWLVGFMACQTLLGYLTLKPVLFLYNY